MDNVISLNKVTKTYGSNRGVDDVTLDIEKGKIVGFLGPNGAGKTTTISMLVDLIRPTKGQIKIFGLDTTKDGVKIRQRIGFLSGDFALDEKLTGWQQLNYLGHLRGNFNPKRVNELAKHLSCDLSRKIKTLSRGNRQKVGLISALMHDPELLIFDEPTTGLDPLIQAEFNKIIAEHKAAGKTALISSHLLSEVQEVCDELAFIREGRLLIVKQTKDLANGLPKLIKVVTSDQSLKTDLKALSGIDITSTDQSELNGTYHGDMNDLIKLLAKHKVNDVSIQETDLETIFMKFYQGENRV
ncbi:MAG TPA: ABC transporter ATP-binding protein [Candidatus Saccharimonadales bacterium]|nr:ABC transporter ATP-binding protein [Candidatus Saccharimonadales bacterium]